MEAQWHTIVEKNLPALAEDIKLNKVLVNRSGSRMEIRLVSGRLISNEELSALKRAVAEAFPKVSTSVTLSYPDLAAHFREATGEYAGFMCALVALASPGAQSFISKAEWGFERDSVLTLSLESKVGAEFLKQRRVGDIIAEQVKKLFGIECTVSISGNGDEKQRLEKLAEFEREEEKRVAELAKKRAEISAAPVKPGLILGKQITGGSIEIRELTEDAGRVTVEGEIISSDIRSAKNDTMSILSFTLTDYTDSVYIKAFDRDKKDQDFAARQSYFKDALIGGKWVRVRGKYQFDNYQREMVIVADDIVGISPPERIDEAEVKRVELHLHTNMSAMDAVSSAEALIDRAARWGHRAVAITDHGVLQSFPEAFAAAKQADIKLIPGCEGYMIDDTAQIVERADSRPIDTAEFVVVDFETTGLKPALDSIIEIGAVKFVGGVEVGEFSTLIDPRRPIPKKASEISGIDDVMVKGAPALEEVVGKFAEFCEGAVLVAHNAAFDMAFMERAFDGAGLKLEHPQLDTLSLARNLYPQLRSHKLGAVVKHLGIKLEKAHRATHDARATGLMLVESFKRMRATHRIDALSQINYAFDQNKGGKAYHIILLAKNQDGLINLNRLVSDAHLNHFYHTPRMPRGLINQFRDDLIIGSACESGELFQAVLKGKSDEELREIAEFYDFLEIQPISNNGFLVKEGTVTGDEGLRELNRRIVRLGEDMGKPVVATGDVHYLDEHQAIFRSICMASKGFEDVDDPPLLHFRTTGEMLSEFSYLGEDKAREVVVENTNAIADAVEPISIFIKHPEGKETFQPLWEESEDFIRSKSFERAKEIYGDPLPDTVTKRLDKELGAICGYGFSTLYHIAVKLVDKSAEDGYIVGSRGSVGSSLVAFLTGITEVNALPPHYICLKCKYSDFEPPTQFTCGFDLPPMSCPECGSPLKRDGFNIPFEVFLGFKGDKVPDIDLNFSSVYQPVAHAYVKELFGAENVLRAGTIGTVLEKTAYGYVKKYLEARNLVKNSAEVERLAKGCTDVKRTTGQHPGGMVILPKGYEIYQFTAIQHPADDLESDTIITHFNFKSMHDVLVKLDLLGHDDPTMLRNLQDLTGISPNDVPLDDPEIFANILSLFKSTEALGIAAEDIMDTQTGTLGVPEFGTAFVRGMLGDTKPSSMEELVRISGLSHGTNVWLGNTQDIIREGIAPLRECICTRDDIMNQLIDLGVPSKMSFDIMESVRKGKGLNKDMEAAMREHDTPEWFIESCKKIEYMFPKAHAVAYVTMALRIAYFKIYHPAAYYACYFGRNVDKFDAARMVNSPEHIKHWLAELRELGKPERDKEEDTIMVLESIVEMQARGMSFLPIDVYLSDAERFTLGEGGLRAPLIALSGLGLNAAQNIVSVREKGKFISEDDMLRRRIPKSVVENLRANGALSGIPKTSQVNFFDLE